MKQILFVLILLFAFAVQLEAKNKTLETVKFRNMKYDPKKIFRNLPVICELGKVYKCDSKNSCNCVPQKKLNFTAKINPIKPLNVSSEIKKKIMPKLFSDFEQCQPGFVYDCTYKYRPFSHLRHRHCTCIKKKSQCKEGYSYQCRRLPGWYPGLTKESTYCQCEKDKSFMKNNKRISTFISSKN